MIEKTTEALKTFIADFFAATNLKAIFSENGEHFAVWRNS